MLDDEVHAVTYIDIQCLNWFMI